MSSSMPIDIHMGLETQVKEIYLVFSWLTEQNMTSNYIAQDVKTT
jgi:hypothetical protein